MMTLRTCLVIALLAAACGGPALQNVPKPDPAVVAGVAAGVAGAATLADPDGAAKRQEQKKPVKDKRPMKSGGTVPADVFDRLDAKKQGTAPVEQQPTETVAPPEETSRVRPLAP
jgi:cytochrome c556